MLQIKLTKITGSTQDLTRFLATRKDPGSSNEGCENLSAARTIRNGEALAGATPRENSIFADCLDCLADRSSCTRQIGLGNCE